MNIKSNRSLYISNSGIKNAGRGVFTSRTIKKGELIEICPVIVMPRKEYKILKGTLLHNYYFMWGKVTCAICFGLGSLYNHSFNPNATYKKNYKNKTIEFYAIKTIERNSEIRVNYNYGKPEARKRLWIKAIPSATSASSTE